MDSAVLAELCTQDPFQKREMVFWSLLMGLGGCILPLTTCTGGSLCKLGECEMATDISVQRS